MAWGGLNRYVDLKALVYREVYISFQWFVFVSFLLFVFEWWAIWQSFWQAWWHFSLPTDNITEKCHNVKQWLSLIKFGNMLMSPKIQQETWVTTINVYLYLCFPPAQNFASVYVIVFLSQSLDCNQSVTRHSVMFNCDSPVLVILLLLPRT